MNGIGLIFGCLNTDGVYLDSEMEMMQIIPQTHKEKVAMYMKSCTKLKLAEMLASCNEILDRQPLNIEIVPTPDEVVEQLIKDYCS